MSQTAQAQRVVPLTVPAGTVYYVDSVSGSDSSGTGSASAPYKSLGKLLGATNVAAIHLACGSTWRESLVVSSAASSAWVQVVNNGATIDSYIPSGSTCSARPRITGSMDLSQTANEWTQPNTGVAIWKREVPLSLGKIPRLFVNCNIVDNPSCVPMRTAQWPNSVNDAFTYTNAASAPTASPANTNTVLVPDTNLPASFVSTPNNLTGAAVHVRSVPYFIEDNLVASASGSGTPGGNLTLNLTLLVDSHRVYSMAAGDGVILSDKLEFLDVAGEFYHFIDPATSNRHNYLYAVLPSGPNGLTIEAPAASIALTVQSQTNVQVSGINVDMAQVNNIFLDRAPGSSLSSVISSHVGGTSKNATDWSSSIRIDSADAPSGHTTVTSSKVIDSPVYGIDASRAVYVDITSTSVKDTGMKGWAGQNGNAIEAKDSATLTSNTIDGAAFQGIRFSGNAPGAAASGNLITSYCKRLTDCGAIYTRTLDSNLAPSTGNPVISNNQIGTAVANLDGGFGHALDLVAGIYLDDFADTTIVKGNTVSGAPFGLFIHNGSHETVTNNTFWLTTTAAIALSGDQKNADASPKNTLANDEFSGNDLVPATALTNSYPVPPALQGASDPTRKVEAALHIRVVTNAASASFSANPTSSTANSIYFHGNRLFQLQKAASSVPPVATVITPGSTGAVTATYTLAGWISMETAAGTPALDTAGPIPSSIPFKYLPFYESLGTPWQTGVDVVNWLVTGGTKVSCGTTCVTFTPTTSTQLLHGPSFTATSQLLSIAYTAKPAASATLTAPFLTLAGSSTSQTLDVAKTMNALSLAAGETIGVESLAQPASNAGTWTNLQISTPNIAVDISDLAVRPVNCYKLAPVNAWAATVRAGLPPSPAASVSCSSLGWATGCSATDLTGATITFPASVDPGKTRLFLRLDSAWGGASAPSATCP